jgi:hypothetical protein
MNNGQESAEAGRLEGWGERESWQERISHGSPGQALQGRAGQGAAPETQH